METSLSSDLKFIIYKTTNLVNGKFYIGKHQTRNLDDGYIGSGKILKRAIKKYGQENFLTEILYVFNNEWQMNLAEKILVVTDSAVSYNLCSGGQGGFGYLNDKKLNVYGKNGQIGFGGENLALGRIKKPKVNCIVCESMIEGYGKKFCSRSCAVTFNNRGIVRNPYGKNAYDTTST